MAKGQMRSNKEVRKPKKDKKLAKAESATSGVSKATFANVGDKKPKTTK